MFAADGSVGRLVDPARRLAAMQLRLDVGAWGRLPLAAILDPPGRQASLHRRVTPAQTLASSPGEPSPELARSP